MSHPTVGLSADADAAELSRISRSAGGAASFQRPGAAAALAAALRAAGLTDTQLTRPTVTAPAPAPGGGPPSRCRCANVHTRVRAPRGDGLESLALVTPVAFSPQRPDPAHDGRNQSAEGAELALRAAAGLVLHMARGHTATARGGGGGGAGGAGGGGGGGGRWLVRDLLWLVPDLSCGAYQCLEAWVRRYHSSDDDVAATPNVTSPPPPPPTSSCPSSPSSSSPGSAPSSPAMMVRAGVIQQAIVLEALAGASYDTPELLVVGADGLLPKLDMAYLLRYLFNYPAGVALWRDDRVEGPHRILTDRLLGLLPEGLVSPQAVDSYVRRLLTGLQFSWSQAVGRPSGPHAAFKDHMADAATVRLVQRHPHPHHRPDVSSVAVSLSYSLELALRSLNNLVERVHHSPFLYVLTGTDRFVSVERYVAAPVALAAALQLQAAWSMSVARGALLSPTTAAVGSSAPGSLSPRIWAPAAARAAARTAVLTAAAAAVRALACGSPSWLLGAAAAAAATGDGAAVGSTSATAPPTWVAAAGAAVRGALARPLATPEGLLAVVAVLFATGAAAVTAGDVAGRLAGAGAAASGGASSRAGEEKEGRREERNAAAGQHSAVEPGTACRQQGKATAAEEAGKRGDGDAGRREGQREGRRAEEGLPAPGAASWHAERVVVLTATAAAMTALVCLNWAAAVVAGLYLAPVALWQGWAAGRALRQLPQACSARGDGGTGGWAALQRRVLGVLLQAVWVAWNPLAYLLLVSAGASAVGFGPPTAMLSGTAAGRLCAMSAANYWYAAVVVGSFWLFGMEGGVRA